MRLICPNCDAQYEIPVDVMPADGRDVQCSNCNHTWFQEHPEAAADGVQTAPEESGPKVEAPIWDADSDKVRAGVSAIQGTRAERDDVDTALPKRRSLDPSVADVLRAEAELEARARRKDTDPIESQPELGLDTGGVPEPKKARPAPHAKAAVEEDILPDVPPSATTASRRDLLPDIEQINSTLRSNTDRMPDTDPGQTAQLEIQEKRNSRRGSVFALLVVAAMTGAYVYAPQIAQQVPELSTPIADYVEVIDTARTWIDVQAAPLLAWLDDFQSPIN